MSTTKSYRTVPQCRAGEMSTAALYLEREWGESRTLGYAGRWVDSWDRSWAVFQCGAGDGSRWLIRADQYGNVGTFEHSLEREVALLLDVEVV